MAKNLVGVFLLMFLNIGGLPAIQSDVTLALLNQQNFKNNAEKPILYMPIGPSGSGKSTLYKKMNAEASELRVFSFDELRHAWYDPNDYDAAYKASVADPAFYPRSQALFCEILASAQDIYLDATNLNPAKRDFYLQNAKKRGYLVIGLVFSTDLETLIMRQTTRKDKSIAEDQVRNQYALLVPPQINEGFDLVFFLDTQALESKETP